MAAKAEGRLSFSPSSSKSRSLKRNKKGSKSKERSEPSVSPDIRRYSSKTERERRHKANVGPANHLNQVQQSQKKRQSSIHHHGHDDDHNHRDRIGRVSSLGRQRSISISHSRHRYSGHNQTRSQTPSTESIMTRSSRSSISPGPESELSLHEYRSPHSSGEQDSTDEDSSYKSVISCSESLILMVTKRVVLKNCQNIKFIAAHNYFESGAAKNDKFTQSEPSEPEAPLESVSNNERERSCTDSSCLLVKNRRLPLKFYQASTSYDTTNNCLQNESAILLPVITKPADPFDFRDQVKKLVPGEVSHAEFWQRYFYRVHQLECDEARKQALMKRAEQARGDSLGWDDEEDWSGAEEEDPHSDREKLSRQPQPSHSGQKIAVMKPEPPQRADEYETVAEHQKKTELVTQIDPQKQTEPQTESEPQTHSTEITTVDQIEHLIMTEVKDQLPDKLSESVNTATSTEDAAKVRDEPEEAYFTEPLDSHAVDVPLRQTAEVSDDLTHLSQLNNPPLTNLWSLHIPEDVPKSDFVDTGSKPSSILDDQTTVTEQQNVKDSSGVTTNESSTCLADKPSVPNLLLNTETLMSSKQTTQKLEAEESLTRVCVSPDSTSPFESVPMPDPSACLQPKMTRAKVDSSESSEETSESSLEHVTLEGNSDNNTCHNDCPQDQDVNDINISVKGDMVLVGERISPLSDNSDSKELGQEDDWEQDFDIEITEDDLKAADNIAKKLSENLNMDADDWENWE